MSNDQDTKRALDRVHRESESFGTSSLSRVTKRVSDHFSAEDAKHEAGQESPDPAELWGRRIGRILSLIGVVLLIYWLTYQMGWQVF